jgi:hypothetical protein
MNIASTTRLMVAMLAVCLISQPIFAQNVFWSEDFGGGAIPMGWANADANDPTIVWEHETDSGRVTVVNPGFNGVAFQSTTTSNGFVIFDSDGYGQLATDHDVSLSTDSIDCSTQPTVFVRFENQFIQFAASTAELGVSADGGTNWTYYALFANAATGNTGLSVVNQTEELDISAVAGNQANVMLRFRWQGNFEYSWKLDDITLQDAATPLPSDNLALGDFFYVPNNFGTPASQIASDTFDLFGVDVSNLGSSDQTNVIVTAEILDGTLSTVYYMDTVQMGTITAGDPDSLFFAEFSRFFIPNQLPLIGDYAVVYSISSDQTDIDPSDNVAGQFFTITDSTFQKDLAPATAYQPGGGGDHLVGNVYRTDDNFNAGDFLASTVEFAAASNTSLDGVPVTIWLAEVSSNVNNDYSNFDGTSDLNSNPDLTVVGFASHTFPAGTANFDMQTVSIQDLATGENGVSLKPGTRYFVLVDYSGPANAHFQAYGEQIDFFQISTILYTSGWFLGGFGSEITAVVRMNISIPTNTNQVELKNATLDVFPNPAQNYATVDLKLENPTDATLTVSDVTGRVVYQENLNNVSNERLTLDVSQYAAGTYFVKVTTAEGIKTQRLVVTH